MDPRLAEAARSGSINALYALINENPYILRNINDEPFIDTPLHVAVASGNISFAMEMMNLMPSFARKLNHNGYSPLHLAVETLEENQYLIIFKLLGIDPDIVRVKGREGMTPLHLAVKKGDVELVAEFLQACPECIKDINSNCESALHIAIKNDRYEVLQVVVGWIQRMCQTDADSAEYIALNSKDQDGNTALHLASYQNQPQGVKLLLECRQINSDLINMNGLTVLDILETQRQSRNGDLATLARETGCRQAKSLPKVQRLFSLLKSPFTFSEFCSTSMTRERTKISDERRGVSLILCSLILTTTYQTALQPPGGLHQDHNNDDGTVVMKQIYFILLWGCNTLCFCSAILMTFYLLPVGQVYLNWFLWISVPICISYIVSMAIISHHPLLFLFAGFFVCFLCLPIFVILLLLLLYRVKVPEKFLKWFSGRFDKHF